MRREEGVLSLSPWVHRLFHCPDSILDKTTMHCPRMVQQQQ
jgi:hypothetical protein